MANCTLCSRVVAPNMAIYISPNHKNLLLCRSCNEEIKRIKEQDMNQRDRFDLYCKKMVTIEKVKNDDYQEILKNYLEDSEKMLTVKESAEQAKARAVENKKNREISSEREKQIDEFYLSRSPEYEYKIIRIVDSRTGITDINKMEDTLQYYAVRGWRVKSVFTNELGHNASSVGVGGVAIGSNSTIDEVIIILERKVIEV